MRIGMKVFGLAVACLAIACITLVVQASPLTGNNLRPSPVISIDSGPIQGINNGDMLAWLGIPYAAPPVGNLRWRPPQPVEPWKKTFQATKIGAECIQNANLGAFATPGGGEDCLFVNVYVDKQAFYAAQASGKQLPVFVWIHGGSLWVGQGADYDPSKLVGQGVIVVTFNYRLGIFGFFADPAIDAEGHAFANYGQMDQSFLLKWVQRNIASFGGDPGNVTIAGESSGGNSVLAQVISPWSKGTFRDAIVMSGASMMLRYPNFGPVPIEAAEKIGMAFAKAAHCSKSTVENVAACLRQLTTGEILSIQRPYLINNTIIDGDFMPEHPANAIRSGRFNHVTLVNGTMRDEGRFFVALHENRTGQSLTEEAYPAALAGFFGEKLVAAVAKEYPVSAYLSPSMAMAAAQTDYLFACPALNLDRWASKWTDVYAYEFADRTAPSYLGPTTFPLDAAHTFELAYLFPGFNGGVLGPVPELNPLQEKLSDAMVRYWTSVSKAHDWSGWPSFDAEDGSIFRLILPHSQVISADRFAKEHHCAFWEQNGIY